MTLRGIQVKLSGAKILLESLKREGVKHIFGIPGGAIINVFDELYKQKDLKFILTRREDGATFAAEGYARSTGKVGVAFVTSGPAATNTVTGITNAYMDSVPIVVFTGQVPTNLIGNDAFQEADITGITRPCTKHNFLVKRVEDLAETVKKAFYIASTGRPGPVLVDLPKDVQTDEAEFNYPESVSIRGYNPTFHGNPRQIRKVARIIAEAKKPLLYVGGGVISSGAHKEVYTLAKKLCIPVFTTLMGIGAFPETDELSLGMAGMHGTYRANMAIQHCDLLISIGARFDDRVTGKLSDFAPHASIVHIDIDPASISKNVKVDYPIVGDAKCVLQEMLPLFDEYEKDWKEIRKPWLEMIENWKNEHKLAYVRDGKTIKPQYVLEKLYQLTKDIYPIIVSDVGQHQMWVAQFYTFTRPRTHLSAGGLGPMGFGFPAALGAQVANPDRMVINITGDGSFQMSMQELATAVESRLPVKVVILNNGFLGMVRQWQQLFFGRRYSGTDISVQPDFVRLAGSYGIDAFRLEEEKDVEEGLRKMLDCSGPCVVDVRISREENVYPMVPAGAPITHMLLV